MITIKILVFSAIDLEGKFENQDFNQYFFMQNLDMILIEILIGNIDLKLIENIDLLLIGSWFALDLLLIGSSCRFILKTSSWHLHFLVQKL